MLMSASSFALPAIQLYIDGATYDWGTQTWVTDGTSVDLYVVCSMDLQNVMISAALSQTEFPMGTDPNGTASVTFNGSAGTAWVYGYPPFATSGTWDHGDDLAPHDVFPTWYSEFNSGDYVVANGGGIGDVQPIGGVYFDPSQGYINSNQQGYIKKFTVDVSGADYVHFDAYTVNPDGSIAYFAPFSHDGEVNVPEPGTMLLFAAGLAGAGMYRRMRNKA